MQIQVEILLHLRKLKRQEMLKIQRQQAVVEEPLGKPKTAPRAWVQVRTHLFLLTLDRGL